LTLLFIIIVFSSIIPMDETDVIVIGKSSSTDRKLLYLF